MSETDSLVAMKSGTIGYGNDRLFDAVSLEIRKGDFWGIIGPNGAGKSTLLKTLLGVIPPIDGRAIRHPEAVVGYVPQRAAIDPIYPFTALEVVRSGVLGRRPGRGRGFTLRIAAADQGRSALGRLGIETLAGRAFRDLSGGEQQRVLVARALVREPDLLVLDEPTAGMDLPSEKQLLDTVTRLNREFGIAVLLVVHQISLVVGRARHLAILNRETGLFHASPAEEILNDSALTALYGRPMSVLTGAGGLPMVVAAGEGDGAP